MRCSRPRALHDLPHELPATRPSRPTLVVDQAACRRPGAGCSAGPPGQAFAATYGSSSSTTTCRRTSGASTSSLAYDRVPAIGKGPRDLSTSRSMRASYAMPYAPPGWRRRGMLLGDKRAVEGPSGGVYTFFWASCVLSFPWVGAARVRWPMTPAHNTFVIL
eukprot:10492327-Heterocapsa_arctica.AAC.1